MARILAAILAISGALSAQDAGDYTDLRRFKITVNGETRKAALITPKKLKKKEVLPLVIAIPHNEGRAMKEPGIWEQRASMARIAVLSVDCQTCLNKGWLPSEQQLMQADMEAIEGALAEAKKLVAIDDLAILLTGHSGGSYVAYWMGLRRPELFTALCIRGGLWYEGMIPPSKYDKYTDIKPQLDLPIFIYWGSADTSRSPRESLTAIDKLRAGGYKNVTSKILKGVKHEAKPEPCIEWFEEYLKKTAKARKEGRKIAREVTKLRALIARGKTPYSPLKKLVDKERSLGARGGAQELLDEILVDAKKQMKKAVELEADAQYFQAANTLKAVEKKYSPLEIGKKARKLRSRIVKTDAYKADEIYHQAMELREKGKEEKAVELLEKLAAQYPETPAGERAKSEVGS